MASIVHEGKKRKGVKKSTMVGGAEKKMEGSLGIFCFFIYK